MSLTPKQRAFGLVYVETGNASEAYRQAYDCKNSKPETINKRASELLQDGAVAGMIADLQESHRKRHEITVDSLTEELEAARMKAMAADNGASAAVQAVMGKAKLHGLITDKLKAEHSGKEGGPLQIVKADYGGWEKAVEGSGEDA